jgi:hypothetical protein
MEKMGCVVAHVRRKVGELEERPFQTPFLVAEVAEVVVIVIPFHQNPLYQNQTVVAD